MKYFIFDTETSGLPNFKLAPTNPVQPDIVQLAGALYDTNEEKKKLALVGHFNILVHTEQTIQKGAQEVHGITQEHLGLYSVSQLCAIHIYEQLASRANALVAYNIQFDIDRLSKLYHDNTRTMPAPPKTIDIMKVMTPVCKLPKTGKAARYGGYKWPKLAEAYLHVFGKELPDAHDAMGDVKGTAELLEALLFFDEFKEVLV